MVRRRTYSANLDTGKYPVADTQVGPTLYSWLYSLCCCISLDCAKHTDEYDSDSSNLNNIDSDSDEMS